MQLLNVTSLFATYRSQLPFLDSSSFLTADSTTSTSYDSPMEKYLLAPLPLPTPIPQASFFAFHTCARKGLSDPSLNSHSQPNLSSK